MASRADTDEMRPIRPRTLAIAIALLLVLGACSDGAPAGQAPVGAGDSETTTTAPAEVDDPSDDAPSEIIAAPATDLPALDPADEALVALEAQWLCDLQRRSFTELADLETARSRLLSNSGVTRQEYSAFQDQLAADTNLRLAVLHTFQTNCAA